MIDVHSSPADAQPLNSYNVAQLQFALYVITFHIHLFQLPCTVVWLPLAPFFFCHAGLSSAALYPHGSRDGLALNWLLPLHCLFDRQPLTALLSSSEQTKNAQIDPLAFDVRILDSLSAEASPAVLAVSVYFELCPSVSSDRFFPPAILPTPRLTTTHGACQLRLHLTAVFSHAQTSVPLPRQTRPARKSRPVPPSIPRLGLTQTPPHPNRKRIILLL